MPSINEKDFSFDKQWLETLPDDVEIHLTIDSSINPTEDQEKVLQAASLISHGIDSFPFELEDQEARHVLNELSNRVIRQQIMDATRRHLLGNLTLELGMTVAFINKQVALHGRLNFSEEAPMGPLVLKIISNRIDQVLNHYFPKAEWRFPKKNRKKSARYYRTPREKPDETIEEIDIEDVDLDKLDENNMD
ncbi:MAG: RNA-binding domain-containing protein [Candidatus Odinarchaeota archaeon]